MTIKILLAALLVPALAFAIIPPQPERNATIRIIGGVDAEKNDFPYLVSLQLRTRQDLEHFCGGSLLDATTILTAAHCVRFLSNYGDDAADVFVRVGSLSTSSGGDLIRARSLVAHPDSMSLHAEYGSDVGIIKLSDSVPNADSFEFAALSLDGSRLRAGTMLSTAGWGQTTPSEYDEYSDRLQKIDVPFVTSKNCEAAYRKLRQQTRNFHYPEEIDNTMFCAGYTKNTVFVNDQDACPGDSGGPIVHTASGAVIGLVSLGMPCGEDGAPGVYANIAGLRDFIDKHMG
ncbi:hypothetical protein E8E12_000872 [Didymella heteroderae]|uniref:Peptidase S1 domain-containing protein n=1 Tax=Didymella heteroderae TaxID=1769908 RepID=A0A9P4WIQ0_9PLEO|nr:hypothetical protein E8E12_000872 [Didymella heteroderae]